MKFMKIIMSGQSHLFWKGVVPSRYPEITSGFQTESCFLFFFFFLGGGGGGWNWCRVSIFKTESDTNYVCELNLPENPPYD